MDNQDPTTPKPSERGATDATAAYQSGLAGEELVRILDQYLADLEAGSAPQPDKLLAEHPALASQLEACLSGIEFIHRAAHPGADAPAQLGDFAIVHEVGRGGMGVVYEAQQLSLKRKVALKVLRFAGIADRDAMERFQREAETVALLHHTNIVPIFAIGEQKGVFYYAMQFIEGRSLAAVLEQSQKGAAPLDLAEAARWAMQAAEALAHAHQRNVIHRDVKPSNLILDPAGQIWLTDFGLAKRLDDAALSMTGALLGTPRYMSPEQASAAKQPVDQRTDIYSLGATLYELATGKPLFEADSAHGIISQILTAEPPTPRSLRAGLPRDLETIILKCLAKEPQSRYATAQDLADDLRAFCDGRAIKARRASIAERTVRWVQKRKKSAAVASIAAAATLAIAIVSYVAYHSIAEARLVHFAVDTEPDQHFKVEVLDEAEEKTIATFTAPTQQPQVIPAGQYHVRLSRAGQLSETAKFAAAAGGTYSAVAALSPRKLWEMPVDDSVTVEIARVDGRDDVFLADRDVLRRMDGATGREIWQISLAAQVQPLVEKAFHGETHSGPFFWPNKFGSGPKGAGIVQPPSDLGGDGKLDLIWASRSSASLVAVSAESSHLRWCHECQAALPNSLREDQIQFRPGVHGTVVGAPLLADAGGKKIVAALYALNTEQLITKAGKLVQIKPQLWLEALDARTGETLWRRPLDWIDQALMGSVFYKATTWKHGERLIGAIAFENRLLGFDMLSGAPAWPDRELCANRPLAVRFADLRGDGDMEVLLLRETRVDADSVGQGGKSVQTGRSELRLTALSPYSAAPLWERPLKDLQNTATPMDYGFMSVTWADWPLVVNLDGKGKLNVVVPFVDRDANACGLEVLHGATGATTWKKRLSLLSRHGYRPPQPDRIVVGPDLDGDGYRELFAASYDEGSERVYVDALSGQDGRILWSNQEIVLTRNQPGILPLRWWQPGSDGWPLLVVPYGNNVYSGGAKADAVVLAASTGRVEHQVADLGTPEVFDLNGDGLPDLLVFDSRGPRTSALGGTLRAIKGTPPAAWRVIGRDLSPSQDFNRGGYTDFFAPNEGAVLSGRDAAVVWQHDSLRSGQVVTGPLPDSDLDGDGVPDLLSMQSNNQHQLTGKIVATSGRDGKTLWTSQRLADKNTIWYGTLTLPHLAGHILEEGKKPDVLVLYQRMDSRPLQGGLTQTCLLRLSGQDGRIVWEQALGNFCALNLNLHFMKIPFATADLDGDGVKDLVFWLPVAMSERPAGGKTMQQASKGDPARTEQWVVTTDKPGVKSTATGPTAQPLFELWAISGRDGKLLWRRPGFFATEALGMPPGFKLPFLGEIPAPVVCDPSGGGNPLVLVTDQGHEWLTADRLRKEFNTATGAAGAPCLYTEVLALNGTTGKQMWSWRGEGVSLNLYSGPLESAGTWKIASPQIVRTAAGPAIVVSVFDESLRTHVDPKTKYSKPSGKSGGRIVVLNTLGEVLQKTDDKSPDPQANFANFPPVRPQVWVDDLRGEGQDTLVWCNGQRVRAKHATAEGLLWERALPAAMNCICGIQPAGKGFPATIAVESSNGMVGLAGPTGKIRWRCDADHVECKASSVLKTDDPQGLPRIWSIGPGTERTSYAALATDDRGDYVLPKPAAREYDSAFIDRRLLRPLPWTRHEGSQSWDGVYVFIAIANLMLAMILGSWPGKVRRAPDGSVILVFTDPLILGSWPGKVRRAAWLCGLWLVPWLAIEVIRFVLDARQLGPSEQFDWSECWAIDFQIRVPLLLTIVVGWWLGRLLRWITRKIFARMYRVSGDSR